MADPAPRRRGADGIADRLSGRNSTIRDLSRASGTQRDNTVLKLQGTVAELAGAVGILQAMQAREYAEFNDSDGLTPFSGWGPSPCSVSITSGTGRIEIEYGGALNNGDGFFCYQVAGPGGVIVSRDSILTNIARRVAVTGGVNFTPSGSRSQPIDVPVGVPVTVSLELYAEPDDFAGALFFGGSIAARVVA